jgi:phospholipid transport system substrate-binding protein
MQVATSRTIFFFSVLTFAVMLIGPPPGHGLQAGPLAQVKASVDDILAILNDQQLAQPGREEERQRQIMAEVRNRFGFREMSKLTLARHWRDLSETEQERFVELFAELLKNTYISRVESYYQKEVRVNFLGEEIRGDKATVATVVITNGTKTPIEYRLKQEGEEWTVYDVVIEGVSLIRNYRTQFTRIIEREKFPGLLQRIQNKVTSNEAS